MIHVSGSSLIHPISVDMTIDPPGGKAGNVETGSIGKGAHK